MTVADRGALRRRLLPAGDEKQPAAKCKKRCGSRPTIVDAQGHEHNNGLNDIEHGEIWRLVTPIFLHFGILHLVFNMMAFSALGTMIEIRRGSLRLAVMILVLAVASNVGQFLY